MFRYLAPTPMLAILFGHKKLTVQFISNIPMLDWFFTVEFYVVDNYQFS